MRTATPPPEVYQLHVWVREMSPMIWRRLLVRSDSTIGGGWQRKAYNSSHQPSSYDLPLTYNTVLRGYSKPFPAAFLGINLMKSMILIVKMRG